MIAKVSSYVQKVELIYGVNLDSISDNQGVKHDRHYKQLPECG